MASQHHRREAAGILRRIAEDLPNLTPVQRAFLLGQASGLDEGLKSREWALPDSDEASERAEHD
jgi:hypothetical protein